MKDLEIYELDALSEQQRRELLKRERAWVVSGRANGRLNAAHLTQTPDFIKAVVNIDN